ncbi:MAG: transglutaminase domain-containing protein, partial [Burkholderiales bacterium]|nr:transglutaminase domain-containing protein [Burkholderiales bacterium]
PKSSQVDRIQVAMHVAVSDEMDSLEPFLSIDLPEGVAVDQATLIVKSASDAGEIVGQEMTDFVAQESEIEQGKIVQRFTLSKPWSGAQNLDKFSRPSIYLSLNSWSDIAARHAKFYQQQLALDTKNAFRQAGVDGEQFERLKGEDIKTVAFHWYKWLGEHFSYFDVGLDFDSATRDQSQPISALLRKRHGDCKDFALIYVKLLAMSGIDAEPVNTLMNPLGPNPLQHTIPRNHAFNHVIVYIPALDMYVDPTSSVHGFNTFSEFSNQSALFANTHGLHLFSGHLVEIHPGMLQRQISVHTDIEKKNNVWVGTTTWSGKGDGYITLGLIQRGREKRLNSGKNYDVPFNRSNISYIPDSWEFKGNDLTGEATIRFSFQLKEPLVDANNQLQHIPVSPMSVLLFKYDTPNLIAGQELSCFGVEASEEIVRVHGAPDSYHLDDLKDVKLSGVDSEFSQSSTSQEDVFTLRRQFSTRLKKPRCSASEIEIQRNFYAGIQKITLMQN